MNNAFLTKSVNYLSAATIGLLLAGSANADSAKIMWSGNGHFYQRFDLAGVSWASSKARCEVLGVHLATIPTVSEAGFVEASFLNPADSNSA